ncbi:hypothetical protein NDA16_004805 [Ustilago loliicola]|nr:hypothetical protein NDA16_004805 [Ustilago loliicola]
MYLSKGEKKLEEDGGRRFVPNLVVASGRWDMVKVLETYARFQEGFGKDGFYRWQITSAGKKREYIVWPKDLENMSAFKYPTEFVAGLSTDTDVLILHGTADRTVYEQDAHSYLAALNSNKKRRPNSHRLHLIEGADHMYRGRTQPVVEEICRWYAERQQLKINGKDINDLIDRIQSLSLEYKQASGRAVDDDALKAVLINQAFAIPEYHLVVKDLTEKGNLGDYYTLAKALQNKWKSMH